MAYRWYDKLNPFGFPIHGAIDGFLRYILWSKVEKLNDNPVLIAKCFTETALRLKGKAETNTWWKAFSDI